MNTPLIIAVVIVAILIIGAAWYFLIYKEKKDTSIPPVPPVSSAPAVPKEVYPLYMGCYKDLNDRTLPALLGKFDNPQACLDLANKQAYKYVGLQFGGECWAGNVLPTTDKVGDAVCQKSCTGGRGGGNAYKAGDIGCGDAGVNSIYKLR